MTGLILYCISIALYKAALSVSPVVLFVCMYILRKTNAKRSTIFVAGLIPIAVLAVCFALPIEYLAREGWRVHSVLPAVRLLLPVTGIFSFFDQFIDSPLNRILFPALCILIWYSWKIAGDTRLKSHIAVIGISVAASVIVPVFLSQNIQDLSRYFTPAYGLFCIALGYSLTSVVSDNSLFSLPVYVTTAILICIFSIPIPIARLLHLLPTSLVHHAKHENPLISALVPEIYRIEQTEGFRTPDFFRVASYKNNARYMLGDALLWAPLEKRLDRKLVSIDTSVNYHFSPITEDRYMIVFCLKSNILHNCSTTFLSDYPGYSIVKHIFSSEDALVSVAKKIQN